MNKSLALANFGSVRIENLLDLERSSHIINYNEQVKKNREAFATLVEVTIFLAIHQLPFRGHNETNYSNNQGNFKDLCKLTGNHYEKFNSFLENSTVFKGTSATIQNDVIKSVSSCVRKSKMN